MKQTPIVCGLDIGSWTFKLCAFGGHRFQVLTNQANFRQTPTLVGYSSTQRLIGQSALIKLKTNAANTIRAPHRLIGIQRNADLIKQELSNQLLNFTINNQFVTFKVNSREGQIQLTPQEILIGLISKARKIIENNNMSISVLFISVPNNASISYRATLLKCTEIAIGKRIRLVEQWACLASQYIQSRLKQIKMIENKRKVIFMDLGYSKMSLSLVQFTSTQANLLKYSILPHVGCKNIDMLIIQKYCTYFQKKTNLEPKSSPKALIKLIEAVQRQRTVLSANSQYRLILQYFIGQQDLQYDMKRQQFQQILWPILSDIGSAYTSFIGSVGNFHSIQLIGGGSRIPCIQALVSNIFGVEPSRTLNQTEALVLGATAYASMQCKIFNMKYLIKQTIGYNIFAKLKGQKQLIFSQNSLIPSQYVFNFGNEGVIQIKLFEQNALIQKQIGFIKIQSPNKLIVTIGSNKILNFRTNFMQPVHVDLLTKTNQQFQMFSIRQKQMQQSDQRMRQLYQMKNDYQSNYYKCKAKLTQKNNIIPLEQKQKIQISLNQCLKWIQEDHLLYLTGSIDDLSIFKNKRDQILLLKKQLQNYTSGEQKINNIKSKYQQLCNQFSMALEFPLNQFQNSKIMQIMQWSQQSYQKMEKNGWKGDQLTQDKIQEAKIMLKMACKS